MQRLCKKLIQWIYRKPRSNLLQCSFHLALNICNHTRQQYMQKAVAEAFCWLGTTLPSYSKIGLNPGLQKSSSRYSTTTLSLSSGPLLELLAFLPMQRPWEYLDGLLMPIFLLPSIPVYPARRSVVVLVEEMLRKHADFCRSNKCCEDLATIMLVGSGFCIDWALVASEHLLGQWN